MKRLERHDIANARWPPVFDNVRAREAQQQDAPGGLALEPVDHLENGCVGPLEARKHIAEQIDFVETNEPRMIAFHCFFDEDGNELTIVQVHPDSASMEFHMEVSAKHFTTAFDYLESQVSEQYYGPISETLASELAKWDRTNVAVTHMPLHEGGFTRTNVR